MIMKVRSIDHLLRAAADIIPFPGDIGGLGYRLLILVKHAAALRDDVIEGFYRIEVSIHQRLVDEWPQVLGGL